MISIIVVLTVAAIFAVELAWIMRKGGLKDMSSHAIPIGSPLRLAQVSFVRLLRLKLFRLELARTMLRPAFCRRANCTFEPFPAIGS
jgi:hypothetical protein